MSQDELQRMTETHECSQCGGPLSLIWDAAKNDHALVCGTDRGHQGYKPHEPAGTKVARGKGDKVLGKGGQSDLEKQLAKAGHPLSLMTKDDLGHNKELSADQIRGLVAWGTSLGLKPYLGHVCLYFGKPYVTIDGYYYKLQMMGTQLRVGTRPLKELELQEYQVPKGAHSWLAEAWLGDTKLPTTGLGIVTQEEIDKPSKKTQGEFASPVVHNHPQRLAEKRAEWQLLRKLVPLEENESPTAKTV